MNGKKSKLLRRITRATVAPEHHAREYQEYRHNEFLYRENPKHPGLPPTPVVIRGTPCRLAPCGRRFYQLLKRQAGNGVRIVEEK